VPGLIRSSLKLAASLISAAIVVVFPADAQTAQQRAVSVSVDKPIALVDASLRIRVLGLAPYQVATISATTRDARARRWVSKASFRANEHGTIDLAHQAPLTGSYRGNAAMGLFWSMLPVATSQNELFVPAGKDELVTLSVRVAGRVAAQRAVLRKLVGSGVIERDIRLGAAGFYGDFFVPAHPRRRNPGVLVFGGSGGGLDTSSQAALLASRGFPALALAYFGEPGLPQSLSRIPLDYFVRALQWLQRQEEVDPERLVVEGSSRGSEAALLLGVHYPALVHAVIALVPSNAAICSFPRCDGPAWLLHGTALPYTHDFDNPHPADNPAAVIQVERIRGPLFLDCGGADRVWVSCAYAQAIVARLVAHHVGFRHVLLRFPAAGHEIGYPLPYLPGRFAATEGRTPDANPRAQSRIWPKLLGFLASVSMERRRALPP
jgi:dienelactone hydrolase